MTHDWTVTYATRQIRVVRTDSGGARLYVDDELLDVTNDLYGSQDDATLAGVLSDNEMFRVEVFITPTMAPHAAVHVNGVCITGDQVYAVALIDGVFSFCCSSEA